MKYFSFFVLGLLFAGRVWAITPVPYVEAASFSFVIGGAGGGTMTLYGEPGDAVSATVSDSWVESATKAAWLRPGKPYVLNFQSSGIGAYSLSILAPSGYAVYIDGTRMDMINRTTGGGVVNQNFTVQILPDTARGEAGTFSGIDIGKAIAWDVALGGLRDGRSAGRIAFREKDLTYASNPATRDRLYYTAPAAIGQISAIYDGSTHQTPLQIMTPQVLVDLVDASGGYWINFYAPSQGSWNGSGYTITGSSWKSIHVESPGTNQLTITETEGSVSRVSRLALISGSVSSNNYVWQLQEGTASTSLRTTIHTSITYSGYREEVIEVYTGAASGTPVTKTKYRYEDPGWGEEVMAVTANPDGGANALTTTYAYHADPDFPGNYRRVKSVVSPTGGWTSYAYHDDWNQRGRVYAQSQPWMSSSAVQSAGQSVGHTTTFDYWPDFTGRYRLPYHTYEWINNQKVGQSSYAPAQNAGSQDGQPYLFLAANDYSDASNSVQSNRQVVQGDGNYDYVDKPLRIIRPDGTQDSFTYHYGSFNPTTKEFIYADGINFWRETVFHGVANYIAGGGYLTSFDSLTVAPIYVVANRSTKDVTIRNAGGNVVRTEKHVCSSGTTFTLLSAEDFTYDAAGRLTSRVASNGATVTNTYANGQLTSTIGIDGTEIQYAYDALGHVEKSIKKGVATSGGYAAQPDIYTYYAYDGANRVTESVTTGQSTKPTYPGGALDLFTKNSYDLSGRTTSTIAPGGYTTGYDYDPSSGGRIVTTTFPGGATQITEAYLDGQAKSVIGTGVVSQSLSYGVESGTGRKYVQAVTGAVTAATVTSYSDWLGRVVEQSKPGWGATTVSKKSYFNSLGQLWKSTQPGSADTLFIYDAMGEEYCDGLDINGNGTLDASSDDRVSVHVKFIHTWDSGATWWLGRNESVYTTSGSTTTHYVSQSNELLSGFAPNALSVKSINDNFGNSTTTYVNVDRSAKLLTTITDTPDSNVNAETIAHNGLTVSARGTTNLTTTFGYDALGRLTTSTDPRTGTTTTYYKAGTSLVEKVTDSSSTPVELAVNDYDSVSGRLKSVAIPNPNFGAPGDARPKLKTYYDYNARGQKLHEWGDATYPVENVYDDCGRQIEMRTYAQSTAIFSTDSWPTSPDNAQSTTWSFHQPTGLLQYKQDADGKRVNYTYTQAGQMLTREWARYKSGSTTVKVLTTYDYYPTTGELHTVTYNDDTPNLTYTYNRLGKQATVTDVTGTRTFTYNLAGTLELQNEILGTTGADFYGDWRITRGYDTATGKVGRYNRLSVGNSGNSYANYDMSYGYDAKGRLNSAWVFDYEYLADSNLIQKSTSGNYTDTRTYDSKHDWIDKRSTSVATTTPSLKGEFEYTQDVLGRVTRVAKTGEIFSDYGNGNEGLATYNGYNDKSELTSDVTKLGATSTVLTGRNDTYAFDNLGNRSSATHNGSSAAYTRNVLNQYTQRTVPRVLDVAGAVDSSATVLVNGVTPVRHGDYFFRNFFLNNISAQWGTSVLGVTPQVKSLNGVYGFNWQNLSVTTPTVVGPTGDSVQVLEFGGSPYWVGMEKNPGSFPQGHGYTFQNSHTYTFGFWARTPSGSRDITAVMTEDANSGATSTTYTIDTNWKWITVTKTYASVGSSPRLLYTWDGGGAAFQVYGAQVADITDPAYADASSFFLAATPEGMSYDEDGNLKSDGRWSYDYDAENRLVSMKTNTSVIAGADKRRLEFKYDYLGRRVQKIVKAGFDGTNYTTEETNLTATYDGWNVIWENGSIKSTAVARVNVWGLDVSGTLQGAGGVGGLLAAYDSRVGVNCVPVYDALGNIHAMIKTTDGSIIATYEYDAFGQTIREWGSASEYFPFRYSTKYTDIETSLVYYGLRYYSPSLGRFINKDPIEEKGGLNLYAFVGNNGVNRWDYLGMLTPADFVSDDDDQFEDGDGTSWSRIGSTGRGVHVYQDANGNRRTFYERGKDDEDIHNDIDLTTQYAIDIGAQTDRRMAATNSQRKVASVDIGTPIVVENAVPTARPDADGHISLPEAKQWWQNTDPNKGPLTVPIQDLNITNVYASDFNSRGQLVYSTWPSLTTGPVYGQVDLQLGSDNRVTALPNEYNFEIHDRAWYDFPTFLRNMGTRAGSAYNRDGTPYFIQFTGEIVIPAARPRLGDLPPIGP